MFLALYTSISQYSSDLNISSFMLLHFQFIWFWFCSVKVPSDSVGLYYSYFCRRGRIYVRTYRIFISTCQKGLIFEVFFLSSPCNILLLVFQIRNVMYVGTPLSAGRHPGMASHALIIRSCPHQGYYLSCKSIHVYQVKNSMVDLIF